MAATPPAAWGEKTHAATAGQTVGPFFAFGTQFPKMNQVAFPHSPGAIVLGGTVYDGAGAPIPDAIVEIWGADSDGTISRARGTLRRERRCWLERARRPLGWGRDVVAAAAKAANRDRDHRTTQTSHKSIIAPARIASGRQAETAD